MNEDKKFDTRLIEKHLEKGIITREEYKALLEQLPDVSDKCCEFDVLQPIAESIDEDE